MNDLRELFEKMDCPFQIKENDTVYNVSVSINEHGYYLCYANEPNPSNTYEIDCEIIEGEGKTIEIAIENLNKCMQERKEEKENRQSEEKPKFLPDSKIDMQGNEFIDFRTACLDYIEFISGDEYYEDGVDDYEHAIWESALKVVYGKDVFDYINKQLI